MSWKVYNFFKEKKLPHQDLFIFNEIKKINFRNPDFSLFESAKEHPDLIFSDACVQLFPIDEDLESFLGNEVIEIIHRTDPRICNSAHRHHNYHHPVLTSFTSFVVILLLKSFF